RKWLAKPGILMLDSEADEDMFMVSDACWRQKRRAVHERSGWDARRGLRTSERSRTLAARRGYWTATVSDSLACQPPPSALNVATAARADSVCACARASEARSRFSSACRT